MAGQAAAVIFAVWGERVAAEVLAEQAAALAEQAAALAEQAAVLGEQAGVEALRVREVA